MSEILAGLIGVLVGVFLGNRLALGRDKRREHNAVVQPILVSLLKFRKNIKQGQFGIAYNESDMDKLLGSLSKRRRKKLEDLLAHYWDANRNAQIRDGLGGQVVMLDKLNPVLKEIDAIECLLKLK